MHICDSTVAPTCYIDYKDFSRQIDPKKAICFPMSPPTCHHRAQITLTAMCWKASGKEQLRYFNFSYFKVSAVKIIWLIKHCLLKLKDVYHQRQIHWAGFDTATARPSSC